MEQDDNKSENLSELSRPTTPKWWRPNYPPKTYYWEEIRRKRQQGGYPWTYLDRDADDMSDNLYEPVDPRPYYGSGSLRNDPDTISLDDRLIDIPPELDIITSEGLDGLDKPDNYRFDGDKEWRHYPEEMGDSPMPKSFAAGIRKELPKVGETSSERPLMSKTVAEGRDQEVPTSTDPTSTKANALTQLKQKAEQVKKQLSKISLPVRPKFNSWSAKLSKKKRKTNEDVAPDDEEEIFEHVQHVETSKESQERAGPLLLQKSKPPIPPPPKPLTSGEFIKPTDEAIKIESGKLVEEHNRAKEQEKRQLSEQIILQSSEDEILPRPNTPIPDDRNILDDELVAELLKEAKSEEKRMKEKAQEVLKRQKHDEKLAKEKAQDELKKAKAEEKALKDQAKEDKKKAEVEDKLLKKKQDEELKKARLEEEEKKRLILEEERQKAAAGAQVAEIKIEAETPKTRFEVVPTKLEMEDDKQVKAQIKAQEKAKLEEEKRIQALKNEEIKKQKVLQDFEESVEDEILKNAEAASHAPKEKKSKRADAFKRKLADIDFTKRFKRSKTPPPRPEQPPKLKAKKTGYVNDETDNKLAAQYAQEILRRDAELEHEKEIDEQHRLHEPMIYVTQPSVETADSESHSNELARQHPQHYENLPDPEVQEGDAKPKFGEKVKALASRKSKDLGQKMKVIGHDLKQFGGKMNVKCKETIKDIKATQEAAKKRSREAKKASDSAEAEPSQDKPEKAPRTSFRFKKRPLNDEETFRMETAEPNVLKTHGKTQPPAPGTSTFDEYFDQNQPHQMSQKQDGKMKRNEVLGRADRDWESPLDLIQSRDDSEEPFSGKYSPPGSSTASSRRQGVLEEIDSDEFFLRERGISEGEDEEEVNRLLMHELRQTFRPMNNSLKGFDMPSPPPRPSRSPRKPPRKSTRSNTGKESNFQTFPPERPKRKQTPGYISAYLNQNRDENVDNELDQLKQDGEDEFMAIERDEDEDEGIRRVKLELRRIDQDMEDEQIRYEPVLTESPQRPRRAKKDTKKSRKEEKAERPKLFYYNTIGANEWMKDHEKQIEVKPDEISKGPIIDIGVSSTPVPPKRVRRKSDGGKSGKSEGGKSGKSETQFSDIDNTTVGFPGASSTGTQDDLGSLSVQIDPSDEPTLATSAALLELNVDDSMDYVDYDEEDPGGGYAVVIQNGSIVDDGRPKTVPRRKQRDKSRKSHSLKRRSQEGGKSEGTVGSPVFCSLPRFTPRTFHIVPPTRPHRTYSSLRPKRPPRQNRTTTSPLQIDQDHHGSPGTSHQTMINRPPASPSISSRSGVLTLVDVDRPGSGTQNMDLIQARPLPPPPRPQRSPVPMNDLDHINIERMIGTRHYANFMDDDADSRVPVVEELCVAKNIPLLGDEQDEINRAGANASESNVGVQTDPLQEEEDFDLNTVGSFEEEDDGIDKQRDSVYRTMSDDPEIVPITPPLTRDHPPSPQLQQTPIPLTRDRPPSPRPQQPLAPAAPNQVIFPSRLHLDELEVDFLRVNELTAQSITMEHLHATHLYVDSMSSSGALVVPLIQSSNLAVDQVNTERISTNDLNASITSVPPASFYQLASPQMRSASPESVTTVQSPLPQHQHLYKQQSQTEAPQTETASRRSSNDDVIQLSVRLGRAILRIVMRGLDSLTDYLDAATSNDPDCQAQQRSQIQILLCLLLVLVVGIFLMSGTNSTQPRWEFFLPPPDL